MADFCLQCTSQFLGLPAESNDMAGLSTEEDTKHELYVLVLCEGCGSCYVDHTGRCVSEDCLYHHGKKET